MSEDDRPDVNGIDVEEVAPEGGTTALLQGLMTMLGEVLGRLDSRLATLEERLGQQPEVHELQTTALAALDRLEHRLERLEAVVTSADGDDATAVIAGLESLSGRLDELAGAVDTIGYGLASLADMVTSADSPGWADGLRETLEAVGAEVAEVRRALVHDPAGVEEALGRLDQEVQVLRSQPGPGPALAMVAAGLAERFEERTDALTNSLEANATYSRRLWERIEELLDGGGFDDLAVGEALEHVIGQLELLTDSVQRSLPSGDGPPASLEAVQTTLTTLVSTVERLRGGSDDLRGRVAALTATVDSLRVEADIGTQPGAGGLARRASGVSRRWASDLGLRGRERERPGHTDEPGPDR